LMQQAFDSLERAYLDSNYSESIGDLSPLTIRDRNILRETGILISFQSAD
jgi:hypothetical protein